MTHEKNNVMKRLIQKEASVIFIFLNLISCWYYLLTLHPHLIKLRIGWFSNRTGTSDDDLGARGIIWHHIWVFALHTLSSTEVPVVLLNQPNNAWVRRDMEFLFECSIWYLASKHSKRVRYWVEEEKFHISKEPCIILFVIWTPYWHEKAALRWLYIAFLAHEL